MNSPVQKIKERLSIEEVVSSYLKLEKAGANLKAKCPFHQEKTASFFVSPDRKSYYCFGCGAKGDIFTFVQEFEGLDFQGALKLLAQRAGVTLNNFNFEKKDQSDRLYQIMEKATQYFVDNLRKNSAVIEYLNKRGLKKETIENFRIGFALKEWRNLLIFLNQQGFKNDEIEKAGLIKKKENFYDRCRNRIIFPIADSSGRIIAFSGRIFGEENEQEAKYLNSPETLIFSKSSVLYGLDRAKQIIRRNNFSILVEGQFDLVLSHQAGFRNTIATSGTALTDLTFTKEKVVSNLGLLRRLSSNIILAFDSDSAGLKAVARAGKIALSIGMDVKAVDLEEGFDPADLISQKGPEAWREAIRSSKHLIEFFLYKLLKDKKDSRLIGKEVREKILPYVSFLESSIEQDYFLKKISLETGINENALIEDFKKINSENKVEKEIIQENKKIEDLILRKDRIARSLLGIIFWQKNITNPSISVDKILKEISQILEISIEKILASAISQELELIFEAEVFYSKGVDLKKDVSELLFNFKKEIYQERLNEKMKELSVAEEEKDSIKVQKLLEEIVSLHKIIQEIKFN